MRRFALLALLLPALAACDLTSGDPGSSEFDGLTGDPALLAGTWAWERTTVCNGASGDCTEATPASGGPAATLAFTPARTASWDGTVAGFFDGRDVAVTAYRITVAAVDYTDRSEGVFYVALATGGSSRYGVSRDRLVLWSADGAERTTSATYRRVD